ncbi:hypothetical protein HYPSUDRAFT_1045049 [Hypholoma sublateritium FD-334 SS-4]|uniref:Uncharacterized protein n=1 Tax=Hypholoma sublateritium (strain FD-334 SS-4) TaxID=945553 RepID=A0A0D2M1K7_HYPSF|nr:hypothetical protein HYPSUDRAFT_1045049 [Hypholoma sublateritium FD-334 SS-4]
MGRKGHLQGLLVQKEEQIALLESRIQAYTGRISLLQSRLLATLDTLDVIQTNQAHELSSAARTQAGLREQLDEYKKVVESAELERDDLRDAVGKLIKKVEESNDCKNWPHSRISLSSLPDPLSLTYRKQARSNDEEELLAYATAMVDALRRERDAERRAHAQTQEQAEARILALEAKLSRREAELEAYVVGDGQDRSEVETEPEQITPRVKPRVLFEGGVIADDQITALFDETVARNKRLESEITTLYRRLEKARTKRSESRSDAVPFLSSPTSNTAPTAGQTRLSQEAAYLNSSNASSASNTAALPMHYMPREDPQTPTDGSRNHFVIQMPTTKSSGAFNTKLCCSEKK